MSNLDDPDLNPGHYQLPQQHPRTDSPSRIAPIPVSTVPIDDNLSIEQIIIEAEDLRSKARNFRNDALWSHYRPRLKSAQRILLNNLDEPFRDQLERIISLLYK